MAVSVQDNTETEVWQDVEIICPICRTKRTINIPIRIIDGSKQLTSILIPVGRICDHAIVPFVDKQFKVRGYQKLDALLDEIESKTEQLEDLEHQNIDVIEIKMNIKPEMMVYALHGCFFKQKVLMVIDKKLEYLKDTLSDFFEYIFYGSFKRDNIIQTREEYKRNKKFYTEYLVLEGKDIIGKTKKGFKIEEFKIEGEVIKNFYREGDSILGLKNLRNQLREIHALSHKILEFAKKQGISQPLQIKKAIRYLEDTHFIRIKKFYFLFLSEIVENYFGTKIEFVQDKIGEMIDNMWGE